MGFGTLFGPPVATITVVGAISKFAVAGTCGVLTIMSGCVGQGRDGSGPAVSLPGAEVEVLSTSGFSVFASGHLGIDADSVAAFVSPSADVELLAVTRDEIGFVHTKYRQELNGLRVFGGDIRVSVDAQGDVRTAYGASLADIAIDASLSENVARDVAFASTNGAEELRAAELSIVVPSSGAEPTLAWRIEVVGRSDGLPIRDDVFVDAQSGEVVDRHPQIYAARNRRTHDDRTYGGDLNETPIRTELQAPVGDVEVDQAHDAAGLTYDCLQDLFARDSYDGNGATLHSIARLGDENAYWDGQAMYYGVGFAVADVGTHEMGHAVTSATADMTYQNEPGALNEAASDILSSICDAYKNNGVVASTFLMGEDIVPGGGLYIRNLADPAASGSDSRDHYDNRYQGNEDSGGVHSNSGIANLAFALLTEGGSHPRGKSDVVVVGVGIDKSAQIFYRALTRYMGQNTNFSQGRAAFEQAASDLHGSESSEVYSVREAFAAVGVGTAPQGERPEPPVVVDEPTIGGSPDLSSTSGRAASSVVSGGCSAATGSSPLWMFWLLAFFALRRSGVGVESFRRVLPDEVE